MRLEIKIIKGIKNGLRTGGRMKNYLSCLDDKGYIIEDGIKTLSCHIVLKVLFNYFH